MPYLFIACCLLFTVYCLLFVACCLLFTVYCLLLVVRCLLFVVYCLLFAVYCLFLLPNVRVCVCSSVSALHLLTFSDLYACLGLRPKLGFYISFSSCISFFSTGACVSAAFAVFSSLTRIRKSLKNSFSTRLHSSSSTPLVICT